MKVNEYNQMMAYLLRPAQEAKLVDDLEPGSLKDELLKDFDPSQETYEEYLRRKSLERKKLAIGGGAFVGEKLPNNREGFKLIADRDSIKGPLSRGPKKDQYSVRVTDDKTGDRFQKYFKDETKLNKFIETNSPKGFISEDDLRVIANNLKKKLGTLPTQTQIANEAGIAIPTVQNRLTEGVDYAKPLTPQEAARLGGIKGAETKTKGLVLAGDEEGLAKLQKKVDALNKKYNLADKGVSFNVTKTSSGNFGTTIQYKAGVYRDILGKSRSTGSLKELEEELKKFSKTKLFKNYSKSAVMKAGGIESAIKQIRDAGSKQDLIFDYVLKSKQTPTIEELSKKFNMSTDLITKDLKRLYVNIYRKRAGEGAPYLPGDEKQLSNVLGKVTDMDVDLTKDSVLNLITDAYGDSKQGDALRSKVRKFYALQKKIPKKYQKFFSSQLDHIIPLNFLTQIRSDIPPEDLIRIKPLPGFLNQRAFKAQLDKAIGTAKRISDTKEGKEALKAYSELQTFLPEVLGGISKTGKIKDFGVETLTEDRSLSKAQQTQTKKLYNEVLKFIDNPKISPLLEKIGINPELAFQGLRGSSQLIRKNIPGFLNTFKKILRENPELRVELGDEFSDIENQFAALPTGTMSDVSPMKISDEGFTDTDKLLAGTTAAGTAFAARKPILRTLAKVARPFGFPSVAAGFAAGELLSDDPNLGVAGAELLAPELIKTVAPRGTGILSQIGRFAANPFFKGARAFTPVGLGLMGIEGIRMGMREQDRIDAMSPEEREDFIAEQESLLDFSA
jgi:hypothetical protein